MDRNESSLNLSPIRAGIKFGEGKQSLLDTVAAAYDTLAEDGEPIAVIVALMTLDGTCQTSYHVIGEAGERASLYTARAVACLNADLNNWDQQGYEP